MEILRTCSGATFSRARVSPPERSRSTLPPACETLNPVAQAASTTRTVVPFDADALATHRALVARMAAGEGEALQLLFLEFNAQLHGLVRRILEDPEDAREVVQDTFIKAWRHAASYRPERGEVVSWLVFIARRTAIDRLRKGARRRLLHEALQREPVDDTQLPYDRFEFEERVARHLDEISPAQRQALELAFFRGHSQAQIAAAMQTPVGNVKNHLRRGLQKLRQLATRHD